MLENFERFQFDGQHIRLNSPQLIKAIVNLCRQDAKARGWLLSAMQASAYSELVFASIAFVFPMLLYHGLIPMRFFGGTDDADQST